MNDDTKKDPGIHAGHEVGTAAVTFEENCDDALEHYEKLADRHRMWLSLIPKAITFYKRHGPRVPVTKSRDRDKSSAIKSSKLIKAETRMLALDRNDPWEKYMELLEAHIAAITHTFYIYGTAVGKRMKPDLPSSVRRGKPIKDDGTIGRWPGKVIKATGGQCYYTGTTACVIEDVNGNVFVGDAECSKSEVSFRKKTGKHVSRFRALQAMDITYRHFGGPVKLTQACSLPNTLNHINHIAIQGWGAPDISGIKLAPKYPG